MSWIRTVPDDEWEGPLAPLHERVVDRELGRVDQDPQRRRVGGLTGEPHRQPGGSKQPVQQAMALGHEHCKGAEQRQAYHQRHQTDEAVEDGVTTYLAGFRPGIGRGKRCQGEGR